MPTYQEKVLRIVAPIVLFLGIFSIALSGLKSTSTDLQFLDDASYASCVLAQQLISNQPLALSPGQPAPLNRNALTPWLLAKLTKLTGQSAKTVHLMGALGAIFTLVILGRFCPADYPKGWSRVLAVLLVATLPVLSESAAEANGNIFFVMLVTLAILRFWTRRQRGDLGLGFSSLVPIGLAATFHIEAIAVLVWMGVSESLHVFLNQRNAKNVLAIWLQVLCGGCWILIFLSPAVLHHMREFSVPWPRYFDAAVMVSAGGEVSSAVGVATGSAFEELLNGGALSMLWPGVLVVAGLLGGLILSFYKKENAGFLEILSLIIVPTFVLNLLTKVSGQEGVAIALNSLTPVLVLLSLYTASRALSVVWKRFMLPNRTWKGIQLPGLIAGCFLFLVAGLDTMVSNTMWVKDVTSQQAQRQAVLSILEPHSGVIATDIPGWMSWAREGDVVDLRGKYSLSILARMDEAGQLSPTAWSTVIDELNIQHCVIESEILSQRLHEIEVVEGHRETSGVKVWVEWEPVAL